jgi:hypothetical protein
MDMNGVNAAGSVMIRLTTRLVLAARYSARIATHLSCAISASSNRAGLVTSPPPL